MTTSGTTGPPPHPRPAPGQDWLEGGDLTWYTGGRRTGPPLMVTSKELCLQQCRTEWDRVRRPFPRRLQGGRGAVSPQHQGARSFRVIDLHWRSPLGPASHRHPCPEAFSERPPPSIPLGASPTTPTLHPTCCVGSEHSHQEKRGTRTTETSPFFIRPLSPPTATPPLPWRPCILELQSLAISQAVGSCLGKSPSTPEGRGKLEFVFPRLVRFPPRPPLIYHVT